MRLKLDAKVPDFSVQRIESLNQSVSVVGVTFRENVLNTITGHQADSSSAMYCEPNDEGVRRPLATSTTAGTKARNWINTKELCNQRISWRRCLIAKEMIHH